MLCLAWQNLIPPFHRAGLWHYYCLSNLNFHTYKIAHLWAKVKFFFNYFCFFRKLLYINDLRGQASLTRWLSATYDAWSLASSFRAWLRCTALMLIISTLRERLSLSCQKAMSFSSLMIFVCLSITLYLQDTTGLGKCQILFYFFLPLVGKTNARRILSLSVNFMHTISHTKS